MYPLMDACGGSIPPIVIDSLGGYIGQGWAENLSAYGGGRDTRSETASPRRARWCTLEYSSQRKSRLDSCLRSLP